MSYHLTSEQKVRLNNVCIQANSCSVIMLAHAMLIADTAEWKDADSFPNASYLSSDELELAIQRIEGLVVEREIR